MNQFTQISFSVPAIVAQNLSRRAAPLNIRPTEYARRLFEAAYAARISAERGTPSDDVVLDQQVRQVFLLADCEPDYIAEALGLPAERVTRILEGWRRAAQEIVSGRSDGGAFSEVKGAARLENAAGVEPSPSVPPPALKNGKAVTGTLKPAEIDVVRNLWREGKSAPAIAAVLGCDKRRIQNFATRNRDICPTRRGE